MDHTSDHSAPCPASVNFHLRMQKKSCSFSRVLPCICILSHISHISFLSTIHAIYAFWLFPLSSISFCSISSHEIRLQQNLMDFKTLNRNYSLTILGDCLKNAMLTSKSDSTVSFTVQFYRCTRDHFNSNWTTANLRRYLRHLHQFCYQWDIFQPRKSIKALPVT